MKSTKQYIEWASINAAPPNAQSVIKQCDANFDNAYWKEVINICQAKMKIVFNQRTQRLVGGHQHKEVFESGEYVQITYYDPPTRTGTVSEGTIEHKGEKFAVRIVDWDEDREKAANIAANKGAGEWDLPQLREWVLELDQVNFDLDLTMFDAEERENLIVPVEKEPPAGDPDHVPEPPKEPTTKRGDIWLLGDHRLMCGDSTSIDDVEKLMDGEKADMVFTDPPYNTGMSEKTNKGSTRLSHMFNDDYSPEEWESFLSSLSSQYWMIMKDSSVAYISLDWRRSYELVPKVKAAGFKFSNLIVWDKVVHGLGSDYKYTHEFIHVFKKGRPDLDTHQGDQEYKDIWHIQRKIGKDEDHATKKPIELVERAIKHASKSGHLCADLFGGSGSTLIACEKTNRKCFMMELSEAYCDVIVARWEKYTGKKAELLTQ